MKHPIRQLAAGALLCASSVIASATIHRSVDGESASVNASSWALSDNGISYSAVRKGTTDIPWISPSQGYNSTNSVGFRIYSTSTVDKITYPLVLGSASFAPAANGGQGYTGFAVKLPSSTDFQTPTNKCLLVQWWQGSPYGPPLRFAITGGGSSSVNWRMLVLNNDTKGNPSATPIDAGGGTIAYNSWQPFVVFTKFGYNGTGQVQVWQNGNQVVNWSGKLGYDPGTKPYTGDTSGIANPNQKIQIEFGLYREPQAKKHMYFIDQVKWTSSYGEAVP